MVLENSSCVMQARALQVVLILNLFSLYLFHVSALTGAGAVAVSCCGIFVNTVCTSVCHCFERGSHVQHRDPRLGIDLHIKLLFVACSNCALAGDALWVSHLLLVLHTALPAPYPRGVE